MNILLPLLALFLPQSAEPEFPRTFAPALQRFVEQNHFPGLAIGVVQNGEVVFAQGFGETSRGSGKPITTRSIFHMASVSKPFTATAVMQLVEAGELELSTTIVEVLPYFRLAEDESKAITLLQALTHTSGFPDVRDYEWDQPQHDPGAAERYVRGNVGESMLFRPGQGSRYSNMAFDTLGDVIAKASGMSFEDFQRVRILEPLGMKNSSFLHAETPKEDHTQGHSTAFSTRVSPGPCAVYPYNRRHAPSSTLNSNVEDMCRWMLANLARGELDGARILKAESYDLMWSRDDDTPGIGLSWFLEDFFGRPCVVHSGSDVGFNSHCILLPEHDLGVVVMSNTEGARLGGIVTAALNAALGEPFSLPGPRLAIEFAYLLDEQGVHAAIDRYAHVRETEPAGWDFSFGQLDTVARGLIRKERFDEAVEVAALNASAHEDIPSAHTRLGQALAGAGDLDGARETLEYALSLAPADRDARDALSALGE